MQRPTAPEAPPEYYRGKQKCHTRKTLLVLTEPCPVCFLSHTYEGKAANKTSAALAGSTLPPGSCLDQAKGFQGLCRPGLRIFHPRKTPPGGELAPPEQEAHRRISSTRRRIEHAIGGVNRDRSVKDKIHLLKDGIRESIMATCGGLHNVRLQYKSWPYAS